MEIIKQTLNEAYGIKPKKITLIRKMIGSVYFIENNTNKYVFKVYTKDQEDLVKRTLFAVTLLEGTHIRTPKLFHTTKKEPFICFQHDTTCIGLLFSYIEGTHPDKNRHQKTYATLLSQLHEQLDTLTPLRKHTLGKNYYVDRFIKLLEEKKFSQSKKEHLKSLGNTLFSSLYNYPSSFCHGDFHNENMIMTSENQLYLIDFDTANYTSNIVDIATINDHTNFNQLKEVDIQTTIESTRAFLQLYDDDHIKRFSIKDIVSFIPIRHMELIATIAQVEGKDAISTDFLLQQYHWITSFVDFVTKSDLL